MMPRLTILLGAGGVGKTTLASGLALAFARAGERAALLGVDPARRLRSALGVDVADRGIAFAVPGASVSLQAVVLEPTVAVRRWIAEACPDDAARRRALSHPYLVAVADRLAGFADAIGCARAVEIAERDPDLAELVLDTAPGNAAIELLAKPEKLLAFFDGQLVRWLVRLGRFGRGGRTITALAQLSGADALRDFGAFVDAIEAAIATLVARLERARAWLADATTSLVIVCGGRDDAVATAVALDRAIRELGLAPRLVVVNRALPASLERWSADDADPRAVAFTRYVRNELAIEARVRARLAHEVGRVIAVPDTNELDGASRLGALARLGEVLRCNLHVEHARAPHRSIA